MPEVKNNIPRYADSRWLFAIILVSILVVGLVALLILRAQSLTTANPSIYVLPKLNAFLNGSVALLLLIGHWFIVHRKNMVIHRACMLTAFIFSATFLISYIIYHSGAPETRYGDLNHDQVISAIEKLQAGGL